MQKMYKIQLKDLLWNFFSSWFYSEISETSWESEEKAVTFEIYGQDATMRQRLTTYRSYESAHGLIFPKKEQSGHN